MGLMLAWDFRLIEDMRQGFSRSKPPPVVVELAVRRCPEGLAGTVDCEKVAHLWSHPEMPDLRAW